jgi:DNA primase
MIKNVDEIKDAGTRTIKEVIAEFVDLKRRGTTYQGLCPFHSEKTPSFHVNPDKGIFKCFGCGEGGDAIHFLQQHQGMTFPEALEHIANVNGIGIEYATDRSQYLKESKTEKEQKERYYLLLKQVATFLANKTDYKGDTIDLDGREFKLETIQKFLISIAPKQNLILNSIESQHWSREDLLELGVIKTSKNDNLYDFFINRIVFPVHNHQGKVVGFSARRRVGESEEYPKYLNSSQSVVYNKSKLLYGLHQSKRAIAKLEYAIMVEGNSDVVSLHDHGIENVVAPCGTAFTVDQAKILKRYTQKVVICFDADEAGYEATLKAVDVAIEAGLQPYVARLDDGSNDPDEFVRKQTNKGFDIFIEEKKVDGLLWRLMEEYDPEDLHQKEYVIDLAGRLLASIKSDMLREHYVKELTKKNRMGGIKKFLDTAIEKHIDQNLKGESKLSPEQTQSIIRYGIYEKNHQYFVSGNHEEEGFAISNFSIKPIMLIRGTEKSRRLVEIINMHKISFVADIDTDNFVELTAFKKQIESQGNFLFWEYAKPEHFIKIKRKIYDHCKTCFPVATMGYHKQGFYTWANGITKPDGTFHRVDEYGLINYKDNRYYLPAYSKVNVNILSDDQANDYKEQKRFTYYEGNVLTFKNWNEQFVEVHGENGMIGIAWYLAAIFRDIIQDKFQGFPILNLFGPPQTGKSYMARSLVAMTGKNHNPIHCVQSTEVAFFRAIAKVRNGIAWYDEYSNKIKHSRVEAFKNFWDGTGREKGKATTDNRTTKTAVNSACLLTGQEQPVQDNALFTRCITLNFHEKQRSEEKKKVGDQLKAVEATGALTQITGMLHQYRQFVIDHFDHHYDEVRAFIKQALGSDFDTTDRILNNHIIPCTMVSLFLQKMEFGFKLANLLDFTIKKIIEHTNATNEEDEISTWWNIFEFMIREQELREGEDFIIQSTTQITRKVGASGKQTEKVDFEDPEKILFVRIKAPYRFYKLRVKQEGGAPLNQGAIKHYLVHSPAFVGDIRAKKFNGQSYTCLAFLMKYLPFDLPETIDDEETQFPIQNRES